MTYSDKLRDPRWQKKRLKIMEYAKWRCQICGAKNNTLHCHHSYYTRGKQPWEYPNGSIICICQACHETIHGKNQKPEVEDVKPVDPALFLQRIQEVKEALEIAMPIPTEPPKRKSLAEFVKKALDGK